MEPDLAGLGGQPAPSQDLASDASPGDLGSALDQFLKSIEEPEGAPTEEESRGPAQTPSDVLFMDDLDLSGKELDGLPSQQPPDEGFKPIQDGDPSQPALGSTQPTADGSEAGTREDFLAQLSESLASIQLGGGIGGYSVHHPNGRDPGR